MCFVENVWDCPECVVHEWRGSGTREWDEGRLIDIPWYCICVLYWVTRYQVPGLISSTRVDIKYQGWYQVPGLISSTRIDIKYQDWYQVPGLISSTRIDIKYQEWYQVVRYQNFTVQYWWNLLYSFVWQLFMLPWQWSQFNEFSLVSIQGQEYTEFFLLEYQREDGGEWMRFKNKLENEVRNVKMM